MTFRLSTNTQGNNMKESQNTSPYTNTKEIVVQQLQKYKTRKISVIVQNQIDMSRWRQLFHSWSNSQVLLSIQFYTLELFLRKKSESFAVSQFAVASRLQITHLITNLMEYDKETQEILLPLKNSFEGKLAAQDASTQSASTQNATSSGFAKEIETLYSLSKWHNNLNEYIGKNNAEKNQQASALNKFFSHLDEKLRQSKLLHEADYFKHLKKLPSQEHIDEKEEVIFWMLPFSLTADSFQKLLILSKLTSYHWIIFEHKFSKEKNLLEESSAKKRLQKFFSELEDQKEFHAITQEDIFSANKIEIFSGRDIDAEVNLVTRCVKKILQQKTPTEKILILYSNSSLGNDLRLSFLQAKIPLSIPVQKKIVTTETGKFFSLLIRFLAQLPVDNQELFDFFNSSVLNRYAFSQENTTPLYIYPSAWSAYLLKKLPYRKTSLQEFILLVKQDEQEETDGQTESRKNILFALSQIAAEKTSAKQKPSAWVFVTRQLLEKYLIKGKSLPEKIQKRFFKNLQKLSKLLDNYQSLDAVYSQANNQKLTQQEFYRKLLKDFEEVRINFYGTEDDALAQETNTEQGEISFRPLHEGIGSFVDYAFFCGLNESYFPLQDKGGEILENPNLQKQLGWFEQTDEKLLAFQHSLQFVQKKIIFTYADADNKGPSRVIFSALEQKHPDLNTKKDLLSSIFVFPYTMGKFPMRIAENKNEEKNIPKLPKLTNDIVYENSDEQNRNIKQNKEPQSDYYLAAKIKYQNKKLTAKDWAYFGQVNVVPNIFETNEEHNFSATTISSLAECPQKFYFENILKLKEVASPALAFSIDALHKGDYFHKTAEKVFSPLIEKLENKSYGQFFSSLAEQDWENYVLEKIQEVYRETLSDNMLQKKQLQNEKTSALNYFRFFYKNHFLGFKRGQITTEENLQHFRPWKSEYKFENVILNGFRFQGRIDRIDIDETNKKILLVDYKTGKEPAKTLEEHWRYFDLAQLAIYMLAMKQKLPELLEDQWQEYSISVAYVYVFASPPSAFFPTDKEDTIQYFPIEDMTEDNFLEKIFGKVVNIFGDAEDNEEQNSHVTQNEKTTNKGEQFFAMFQQILQEQKFFSVFKDISTKENIKPSPCKYCEFTTICDSKLFRQFSDNTSLPVPYKNLFYPKKIIEKRK